MRTGQILMIGLAGFIVTACHRRARSDTVTATHIERTVFTDSALHAERCEPVKAGEDWRRVCTPRDQEITHRKIPPPNKL